MEPWLVAIDTIFAGRATANDLESSSLEFKRQSDSIQDTQNDVADAAACFANDAGGVVVVGVLDRITGPTALAGTTLDVSVLRRRIYEVTKPNLGVTVREFERHGVRFLAVHVEEGLEVYASRQRTPARRFEDRCLPMTTTEISRLHDDRRGTDWSATDSGRLVEEADESALAQVRNLLRLVGDGRSISMANASTRDLLARLGLAFGPHGLTRAGELLLCRSVEGDTGELLVYQRRQTPGGESSVGRRWRAPLVNAFVEAMAVIEARISTTPLGLASGQQIQLQDYPLAAIREAVANAVTHGDHRDRRPIQIEHSPELMEIRSPGPLVTGISPSNILTHPAKPRFPSLADAMRSLGLAEQWGQGVDRMYREMIRSGRDAPSVSVEIGIEPETVVRFLGGPPNARIVKFIASLPPAEQDDVDTLLIVSVLARRRTINADGLAPIVQRDVDITQRVLVRLATGDAQLVEPTPRTVRRSHPDYQLRAAPIAALGPAIGYRSRTSRSDGDLKIQGHLAEYGSVNNATVQRMFDVDVQGAHAILRDLVDRGVIVRTSEQSRGTAVRYGPGPSFVAPGRTPARRAPRASDEG